MPGAMLAYAACGRTELDPREADAATSDARRDSNVADVASEPTPPPPDAAADLDVATGQQITGALAVDADCVYWSIDPSVSEIRVGPK